MSRSAVALLSSMALCGCVSMTTVTLDAARLNQPAPPGMRMACQYRLDELVDARPTGGSAGNIGMKAFAVSDPIGIVRDQLAAAGLRADAEGRDVDVRLMQFYIAQNTITMVPVVVYEATIAGKGPMVVRGQPASMNHWGSDEEATRAYIAALREANARLVTALNAACP